MSRTPGAALPPRYLQQSWSCGYIHTCNSAGDSEGGQHKPACQLGLWAGAWPRIFKQDNWPTAMSLQQETKELLSTTWLFGTNL